jgi:hypothetical protein
MGNRHLSDDLAPGDIEGSHRDWRSHFGYTANTYLQVRDSKPHLASLALYDPNSEP